MSALPTPNAHSIAFGNALRQARAKKDLKQQALAEAADLAHSYVSNIEKGKRNPSLATILKLTRVLDTTPAKLMRKMDSIRRAEERERKRTQGAKPTKKASKDVTHAPSPQAKGAREGRASKQTDKDKSEA